MKIISLNIEKGKHFEKHKNFLLKENPDVLCLQELPEKDIKKYQKLLGFEYIFFKPMVIFEKKFLFWKKEYKEGVAIFSHLPDFQFSFKDLFDGQSDERISIKGDVNTYNWRVLILETEINHKKIHIANIHGIDTERGDISTPKQLAFFDKLVEALKSYENLVLVGDSNAPRGYEAFAKMDKVWKDNIPQKYTTSIDNKIHRAGYKNLQYVIDVLFTKGGMTVKNVRYQDGLSDHYGLVAGIK